jgi:hypothetical protein
VSRPVVLYNPRGERHILPLALVHLGSMLPGREVVIVDGRVARGRGGTRGRAREDALCLGVTVLTGAPILDALRISRAARSATRAAGALGRLAPSLLPEQCLASGVVDACVNGQGERTFEDVVAALESGRGIDEVAGLAFLREGRLVTNPARPFEDVNRFPRADFGLLDLERYFAFRGVRRLDYCSSQGCPFECSFCADPMVYKQRWSGLRAERVVDELREHVERHRLAEVFFNDDNFFTDLRRTEAICRGLLDAGVRIRWFGTGRGDLLRPPDARPARAAARQRLLQGQRRRRERQPRAAGLDQEGHAGRGGAGDGGEAAQRRDRRALLVHRRLPAGAAGKPRRHLPRGEGAAPHRRRVRDADLFLRALSGDRAGRAHARDRLPRAAAARGTGSTSTWITRSARGSPSRCGSGCLATTSTCATATSSREVAWDGACCTTPRAPAPSATSTASTSSAARSTS